MSRSRARELIDRRGLKFTEATLVAHKASFCLVELDKSCYVSDFLKCNSGLSFNKTELTFQGGALISRTNACNSAKLSRGDCLYEVDLQNRCSPCS